MRYNRLGSIASLNSDIENCLDVGTMTIFQSLQFYDKRKSSHSIVASKQERPEMRHQNPLSQLEHPLLRESPKMSFQTFSPQFEKTNAFIPKYPHQREDTQLSGTLRTKKLRMSKKPNDSVLSMREPSTIFS